MSSHPPEGGSTEKGKLWKSLGESGRRGWNTLVMSPINRTRSLIGKVFEGTFGQVGDELDHALTVAGMPLGDDGAIEGSGRIVNAANKKAVKVAQGAVDIAGGFLGRRAEGTTKSLAGFLGHVPLLGGLLRLFRLIGKDTKFDHEAYKAAKKAEAEEKKKGKKKKGDHPEKDHPKDDHPPKHP